MYISNKRAIQGLDVDVKRKPISSERLHKHKFTNSFRNHEIHRGNKT